MDENKCDVIIDSEKIMSIPKRERHFPIEKSNQLVNSLQSMWGPCYVRFTSKFPEEENGGVLINNLTSEPLK